MKTRFVFLVALLALTFPFISQAQIPRTLSYQGVLTDNAGNARPDGNYVFTFCLYASGTGGTSIWCETKTLAVKKGLFSTVLGDQKPFGAAVKFDTQYWLGIQVGSEPELSPRMALTSVGYSFSSLRADTAGVSVASLADTTWRHSGANIYRMNGNVGIGTGSPTAPLTVKTTIAQDGEGLRVESTSLNRAFLISFGTNYPRLQGDDGLSLSGAGSEDHLFATSTGNIGIGTINPGTKLEVVNNVFDGAAITQRAGSLGGTVRQYFRDYSGSKLFEIDADFTTNQMLFQSVGVTAMSISGTSGNVGIGTSNPGAKLEVVSSVFDGAAITQRAGSQGGTVRQYFRDKSGSKSFEIDADFTTNLMLFQADDVTAMSIARTSGNVGIGITSPTSKLHVEGTTTTKVLAITGGGDLAEPFEISENQPIPQGSLVIIDEENPGQLKLSHQTYDKRVAGVVSGAGGINPGLTLTQEGVLEGGQNVALSGRVYALATAANGPIKPGDLLTTSDIPGHAMRATDFVRWQGAVIGKAMSGLEKGEGLVLVLINLQ